jgi:glycosyltransferase involved in cell wall biosynthesis
LNTPLVSIIMPTFNRAHSILKSIYSVLCQNYQHLELIIIDDGSTDHTTEVIDAIDDPRIIYLQLEQNEGPAFARNIGISRAKGEYIAFIDSDDKWLPGKLLTQVNTLIKYINLDMLLGDYLNINHITGVKSNGFSQTKQGLEVLKTINLSDNVYQIMEGFAEGLLIANFVSPSTVIIRSIIYNKLGGFLRKLRTSEDMEVWWRLSLRGATIGFINEILIERHKDESSLSANLTLSLHQIDALDECRRTAEKNHKHKLIELIDNAKQRAWQYYLKENAKIGRRKEALQALKKCLHYGLSWRPFFYFGAALCGPGLIEKIKKIKKS